MYITKRATKENNIFGFVAVYVVMVSQSWSMKPYEAGWMQDEILSPGPTFVPDVDIVDDKDVFVFDSDDSMQNELDAVAKMKELWAQVQFNGG
jgi:hypothetical protein